MKLITKDSRRLAKNEWNTIFVGKVWAKFVKLVAPLVGKYPKAHCKDFVDSEKKHKIPCMPPVCMMHHLATMWHRT